MVTAQILSKVINTGDDSILTDNMLTVDYFLGYEEEYTFIDEHKEKYGNIPDKETFLAKFPNFEILDVNESDRYLVDTIREEYNYAQSVPVAQTFAKLLQSDANEAIEYLQNQAKTLRPNYSVVDVDIIHESESRHAEILRHRDDPKSWCFESGFPELDDILDGIHRKEEFIAIVARLGQGKSFVLLKMCAHVWKLGFNVGFISPEMSADSVGLRFDTILKNYANKDLVKGRHDDEEYTRYLNELKQSKNKFKIATPDGFDKEITVSKIRNWVKQNKLDLVAIDGIKYLTDERRRKNDNMTTSLTNISEDLMELSVDLGVPVLVVVQANRGGVSSADEDGTPEVENIRDSDGIAHNATRVISLKQKADGVLEMGVKKNRYGRMGVSLNYQWDIDTGIWTYIGEGGSAKRTRRSEDTSSSTSSRGNKPVF